MINYPIKQVGKVAIESLIDNQVPESRSLDYKEKLPGNAPADKKEFFADLTAFANAVGGDIVYGIKEKRDESGKSTGIAESVSGLGSINIDAEMLRLENMIRDGVEPRLNGCQIHHVEGFDTGAVFVIRVPKSYLAPHMIKGGESRFYSRNSKGKYPLDVTEIRSAFALSETLPDKVRRFRDERIARIVADETPIRLPGNPKVILHLIPVAALDPATRIDTAHLQYQTAQLAPLNTNGCNWRHNLDGFLTHSDCGDPSLPTTYLQIFRTGALEAVESMLLLYGNQRREGDSEWQPTVASMAIERLLNVALGRFLKTMKRLGLEPPIFVMLTFVDVLGYGLSSEWSSFDRTYTFDRKTIQFPEAVAESYDVPPDKLLQPAFDAMWQATGYENCRHYKNGRWSDQKDGTPYFLNYKCD